MYTPRHTIHRMASQYLLRSRDHQWTSDINIINQKHQRKSKFMLINTTIEDDVTIIHDIIDAKDKDGNYIATYHEIGIRSDVMCGKSDLITIKNDILVTPFVDSKGISDKDTPDGHLPLIHLRSNNFHFSTTENHKIAVFEKYFTDYILDFFSVRDEFGLKLLYENYCYQNSYSTIYRQIFSDSDDRPFSQLMNMDNKDDMAKHLDNIERRQKNIE